MFAKGTKVRFISKTSNVPYGAEGVVVANPSPVWDGRGIEVDFPKHPSGRGTWCVCPKSLVEVKETKRVNKRAKAT